MAQKFDRGDYVEVAARVNEFYRDYPEGRLQAEYMGIAVTNAGEFVTFRATAWRTPDDPLPATGWAWEPVPGKTPFTKDSEMQNAETSAIGRAIVFLNERYSVKGIASANEVRNRQVNHETTRQTRSAPPPAPKAEKVDAETGEILTREQSRDLDERKEVLRAMLEEAGIHPRHLRMNQRTVVEALTAGVEPIDLFLKAKENAEAEAKAEVPA